MLLDIDVRHILPAIHTPTLVLQRTGDRVVTPPNGRYLADHIPGARYVELPGQDHFAWIGDAGPIFDEVQEFVTGVRPAPDPERILATVLFLDIVGSTARLAELGDRAWRDLLARHQTMVRVELARHHGREISTAGDSFLATFDGPARAVRCACAISDAVGRLGIAVRAGLHTGECEMAAGDVHGLAVHIGARVAALAGPGEVLVSSTVKDLVAGSGLRFASRGVHALAGVPGEWSLFQVDRPA
jgi:class 3 adenylate cyclase